MKIISYGNTHQGKVRDNNEDMFLVDDDHRVYAVADGLGGLPEGSLASNIAIDHLQEAVSTPEFSGSFDYNKLFNTLNEKVHEQGIKISEEVGIGTTLTVLAVNGKKVSIGHVGDCGAYLLRKGELQKITTDHTMAEEMRSRYAPGSVPYIPEYFDHTLTRCLGQQGKVEADVYEVLPQTGDRFLLCSDGITKTLENDELKEEMEHADSPENLVNRLIEEANERGGPDNSTGIAVFLS